MSYTNSVVLIADPFLPGGATNTGAFAGLPQATLLQFIADGQVALHKLLTGMKEAVVSYGEGGGQNSVTFTRAQEGQLRAHIRELQVLAGTARPRKAAGVIF